MRTCPQFEILYALRFTSFFPQELPNKENIGNCIPSFRLSRRYALFSNFYTIYFLTLMTNITVYMSPKLHEIDFLCVFFCVYTHTQNIFRNLVEFNRIWIVITLFRFTYHQLKFHLVSKSIGKMKLKGNKVKCANPHIQPVSRKTVPIRMLQYYNSLGSSGE